MTERQKRILQFAGNFLLANRDDLLVEDFEIGIIHRDEIIEAFASVGVTIGE